MRTKEWPIGDGILVHLNDGSGPDNWNWRRPGKERWAHTDYVRIRIEITTNTIWSDNEAITVDARFKRRRGKLVAGRLRPYADERVDVIKRERLATGWAERRVQA